MSSSSSSSWESYLTPQEINAYAQYFRAANRSQSGIVTGPEAVQFFATSGVPNQILSDIWETADRDNIGHLTAETFAVALKLIACAQHGKEVTEPVLATSVPLPQFEGFKLDNNNVNNATTGGGSSSDSPAGPADGPGMRLTPAEREKYISIFRVHQPTDGVLDATNAKNIFMKSKLPNETLGQIWCLADVRQAGNLNQAEFAIAMHYIAKLMDGTLATLPTQLPPSVYATANGDSNAGVVQPSPRPPVLHHSPQPPPAQATTQQQQRSQTIDSLGTMAFSAAGGTTTAAAIAPETTRWNVTPQEKAQFDIFFDKIDGQESGYVQGAEAVEFFKNSRLPEGELAHIWDLADSKQQGRLTRDQFAVAMHLIHKRLRGEMLPTSLPQSLMPPPTSPHPPPQQQQQQQQQHAGISMAATSSPAMMHNTPLQQHQQVQSPAMTGGSNIFDDQDLLGDFGNNDDQFTQDTNQVNQLQNQMAALKTSTGQIHKQHLDTKQTLEQLAEQKRTLQALFTQVQMQHEAELKELNELQQQLESEKPGFAQAQQEHDAAQQQLTATQAEIAQLQHTLETNRAESERLRQNVHTTQEETQRLVNELNALRNQVKQQNMMLDINRRQVTASEQDRDQAKRDLADFKEERGLPEDYQIPVEQDEEQNKATEAVSSPAASSLASSGNNNTNFFDVFSPKSEDAAATTAAAAVNSPAAATPNDFDAIFGNFGQSSSPAASEKKPQQDSPLSVFDPVGWATPPEKATESSNNNTANTKSSRPAPPPPPPQSRHHRQTSDISHASTTSTTKKPRAPPPPPPSSAAAAVLANKPSSPASNHAQQQPSTTTVPTDDDAFDGAFSSTTATGGNPMNESQVVQKKDEFDDAFGIFGDNTSNKEQGAAAATTTTGEQEQKNNVSGNDLNWASSFGGFEFGAETTTTTGSKGNKAEEDDWDSIFGGGSAGKGAVASTPFEASGASPLANNTRTIAAADQDAFVGFEDAFSSSFDTTATTAQKKTTPSKDEGSAGNSSNDNNNKREEEQQQPAASLSPPGGTTGNSNLDELIKMGFGQKEAKEALERYDQDLVKASNFLLDQSSK
ncbi:hypothetical protein BDB00DRAFT_812531 [Zychaea mexicana]|uniref:uncharacterized protein n=1 Tax=Zychaea mexicana TaxID=64656 RepID=UPI0022FDB5A5|nr:uncharacterized protein BDB00DRAFT_812531 [Zychaea mexicana]KAI9495580.1 hypothetical protein BDB00DRAFT_812531 [Zychaea mexicana]